MKKGSVIKAIIIEDEEQNLERLQNLLSEHCNDINVIGDANGVKNGFELIDRLKPDLLFLDIQLTDGTGFDLLELFEIITFKVIFITAFEEYALKAFRFSALDYLLKPVDPDELVNAVNKAQRQIEPEFKIQFKNALKSIASKDFDKIVLKDSESIYLVDLSDIIYCEADGNYTRFHFILEKPFLVSNPIKAYESFLKDSLFLRVHRSYLINLRHFKRFEKSEGGKAILSDNIEIPIASGRREELFEFIERFKG